MKTETAITTKQERLKVLPELCGGKLVVFMQQAFLSFQNPNAMEKCMERHVEELRSAIKLVQGSLTPALRQKIMCIITIDTHGRDVIQRLLTEKATAVDCFQWQSQLKYFWDAEKVGSKSFATKSSKPPRRAH